MLKNNQEAELKVVDGEKRGKIQVKRKREEIFLIKGFKVFCLFLNVYN